MLYFKLSFKVCLHPEITADLPESLNRILLKRTANASDTYLLATECTDDALSFIAAVPHREGALAEAVTYLRTAAKRCDDLRLPQWEYSCRELTVRQFYDLGETAQGNGVCNYSGWSPRNLGISYISNCVSYSLQEHTQSQKLSYEEALQEADKIMGDSSLKEELERIYSPENEKRFYAHPVHYKITAASRAAADELLQQLVTALYSNGRLPGTRTQLLSNLPSDRRDNEELSSLCCQAQGGVVALELNANEQSGGLADSYQETIELLHTLVRRHADSTLFVFLEITNHTGFTKELLQKVSSSIDIIELREGMGDREMAAGYLRRLAAKKKITPSAAELNKRLGSGNEFTASQLQAIYWKWYSNAMKTNVYRAYKKLERKPVKESVKENNAYKELQQMIGLNEVKGMVDEIINTARMQKLRRELGLKVNHTSLHACFTGNPGCAKTTVARLLARILKKEGILKTGRYVEVGRGDLVGRYVGWTAKITAEKFREARGGILFVDECYALADDSNSFGAEAINTLVQLMENYRDEVIVIFAGYPQKVKDFLAKNEGLRSRISFHINFPDYKAQDLTDILHLMAKEKGYILADDVDETLQDIFEEASSNEEFGNGRFARTLLEQAVMHQASRLFRREPGEEISRQEAELLLAEDFAVNASQLYHKSQSRPVGFGG